MKFTAVSRGNPEANAIGFEIPKDTGSTDAVLTEAIRSNAAKKLYRYCYYQRVPIVIYNEDGVFVDEVNTTEPITSGRGVAEEIARKARSFMEYSVV